ncbi:hypothetical protein [Myceligenerans pegani]|uniref:CopC domain-containing protein n=1 Tax=Myceligenerans pegani TaxID=2776917 RepID=A0ABR9MXB0_9MICO|nr:hypothetical protein [Myceligenerans sp. TRM 65318]MBE1876028.1 hypothetical protein [Myceligenerans sp. TRM 65318]MBE3018299.1 hypothetical protein [Myceligenerans sp. TRM 65318]
MRRFTRLGAALALALGLAVPAATAPAAAHGGPIDVDLGTDGAGGVSATLTWAGDGHPVEESAVVVVRAVSDSGEEVGPVTLTSASEGVGWYRSEPRLLDEGHWTVTARVKEPKKAKVETELDVAAPPTPEASEPEPAEAAATADGAEAAATQDAPPAAGLAGWVGWVVGALVVGAAVTTAVVLRRRTT